jgi:hypothetical protein
VCRQTNRAGAIDYIAGVLGAVSDQQMSIGDIKQEVKSFIEVSTVDPQTWRDSVYSYPTKFTKKSEESVHSSAGNFDELMIRVGLHYEFIGVTLTS